MKFVKNIQITGNSQDVGNYLERAKMYENFGETSGIGTTTTNISAGSARVCSILTIFACLLACLASPATAQVTWTGQGTYETAIGPTVASLHSDYIVGDDAADALEFTIGYDTAYDHEVLTVSIGNSFSSIQEVADMINIQSRAIQPGWNAASIYGSRGLTGYRLFITSHTAGDAVTAFSVTNTGAPDWAWSVAGLGGNAVVTSDFMPIDGEGCIPEHSIAQEPDSTGVVNISGYGLECSIPTLWVGYQGSGELNITNGGSVNNNYGFVGQCVDSTGIVNVVSDSARSYWTPQFLHVGRFGSGVLNITSGNEITPGLYESSVKSDCGYVGEYSDSTGEINISGRHASLIIRQELCVGLAGNGSLNITDGGYAKNAYAYIGYEAGSTGVVNVDGASSTWTNSGEVYIGKYGNGTLEITDGGLVSLAGTLYINDGEDGDSFINIATGGMLALKCDADASGSIDDFLGLVMGNDAIQYWDYALGDWAHITAGTLGEDYTLIYITSGYTKLTVLEQILLDGDANRDGVVSAGDYACIQANFGNTGIPGILGDANGDGVVSAGDYACIQANFGNVAGAVVPEPVTLSLLTLGGLALLRKRK